MVEVTLDLIRGVGPLRNENPRMGVRGSLGEGWRGGDWPTRWMTTDRPLRGRCRGRSWIAPSSGSDWDRVCSGH